MTSLCRVETVPTNFLLLASPRKKALLPLKSFTAFFLRVVLVFKISHPCLLRLTKLVDIG